MKVHNRIEVCMEMGVCKYAHVCASVRAGKCACACGKRSASTNSDQVTERPKCSGYCLNVKNGVTERTGYKN